MDEDKIHAREPTVASFRTRDFRYFCARVSYVTVLSVESMGVDLSLASRQSIL